MLRAEIFKCPILKCIGNIEGISRSNSKMIDF